MHAESFDNCSAAWQKTLSELSSDDPLQTLCDAEGGSPLERATVVVQARAASLDRTRGALEGGAGPRITLLNVEAQLAKLVDNHQDFTGSETKVDTPTIPVKFAGCGDRREAVGADCWHALTGDDGQGTIARAATRAAQPAAPQAQPRKWGARLTAGFHNG